MPSQLNPYLSFRDNAREAMTFYQSVFGGELSVNTFGESGLPGAPEDGVMHASLIAPNGFVLMASDTPPGMGEFNEDAGRITVSLSGDDTDLLRGYWEKLSDGGTVIMPFEKAPWGDVFGMCTDRFGIPWMVDAYDAEAAEG